MGERGGGIEVRERGGGREGKTGERKEKGEKRERGRGREGRDGIAVTLNRN